MRTLFRLVVLLVIAGALLFFFAPRLFNQVGNSLLNSANSSAQGVAQYLPSDVTGQTNTLQLNITGLAANSKYFVTLDPGGCGNAPHKELGGFTSDQNGSANPDLHITNLDTQQVWFVNIHVGISAGGSSVACGYLEMNSQSVTSLNLTGNIGSTTGVPGFPNTGVAPAGKDSYDNSTYPRKY
jgi:hypothetical protein